MRAVPRDARLARRRRRSSTTALALGRTDWIDDGRLAALRYHRAGAARSGVAASRRRSTTSCSSCPGRPASLEDLVAATERGLLLTCLWYIREVDPATLLLTGLTRDGVYLVEDGEVVGAVNNFRFNESPVDLLARATEAGAVGAHGRARVRRVAEPHRACRRCGWPTST